MTTPSNLDAAAAQWLAAREVIVKFLAEFGQAEQRAQHNAAALIARLANHDPPILLVYANEIKDEPQPWLEAPDREGWWWDWSMGEPDCVEICEHGGELGHWIDTETFEPVSKFRGPWQRAIVPERPLP